ncbi:MAG TPA: hypothetical protein VE196_10645 [Pseudonocardiaceae bacterium]|nr:hypothetical protein [Pseudonocardiaceae bacterium]
MTVVSQALAAGAAAGLKNTTAKAVTDAYASLKKLITDRYQDVDVSAVEKKPDSEAKRASLAEDLADAAAAGDMELLEAARQVIAAVNTHAAGTGPAIGVDLERVEAAAVRIRDVIAGGTGIRARDVKVAGEIDISGVRAGAFGAPPDPSGQ